MSINHTYNLVKHITSKYYITKTDFLALEHEKAIITVFTIFSIWMFFEPQEKNPLVGTWDGVTLDNNEDRDRIIYRPEGTWTSLLSVVSDRDEIGYWLNISESKDFNNTDQSYLIFF